MGGYKSRGLFAGWICTDTCQCLTCRRKQMEKFAECNQAIEEARKKQKPMNYDADRVTYLVSGEDETRGRGNKAKSKREIDKQLRGL